MKRGIHTLSREQIDKIEAVIRQEHLEDGRVWEHPRYELEAMIDGYLKNGPDGGGNQWGITGIYVASRVDKVQLGEI